jgi:Peptidase family M23
MRMFFRRIKAALYIFLLMVSAPLSALEVDLSLAVPGGVISVYSDLHEELQRGAVLADEGKIISSGEPVALGDEGPWVLLLPLPCDYPHPVADLIVRGAGGAEETRKIELLAREFVHEEIPLNGEMSGLRQSDDPRKIEESRIMWQLLSSFDQSSSLQTRALVLPTGDARESSHYGDRRLFRYRDGSTSRSLHYGIDYAVPVGTAVRAAAPGKIVLAADRMLTGYTLVIEHGPGIFTLYYHLDSLGVEEGARVEQGQVIASSGMSGLATGPHLHWELRINRIPVDPLLFLKRPFVQLP